MVAGLVTKACCNRSGSRPKQCRSVEVSSTGTVVIAAGSHDYVATTGVDLSTGIYKERVVIVGAIQISGVRDGT